jgi:murein DD-endopeptidase MepM/ murein hydrolase activator NlpD
MSTLFENIARRHQYFFHPVLKFDPLNEKLIRLDFSENNRELSAAIFSDTEKFARWLENKLSEANAKFGIGGYAENRILYSRSELFDEGPGEEPRRIHLGIDIWGEAGTPVFAFMGGMVHSMAFNDRLGDYGATMIILHQLDGFPFYTLYGHLSLQDISRLVPGNYVSIGQEIAHFGLAEENGHWPPHLHFQVILEIGMHRGDYPGVARFSEKEKWLANSPDPDLILQMMQYV